MPYTLVGASESRNWWFHPLRGLASFSLIASKKRFEAREASVALATDKKSRLCERCFANVPATEAFCPECGAAMSHDTGAEGSDSVVYPELARANLLRMRGDYKAAESQCLQILRRYPNNSTANILLGDICAEKGDLDQSMQWYEMALDLTPESQAAQHKLESVKQRFKEKETAQTVEQLGLPTTKSRAGIYAFALIASVFVFAVAMYLAGQRVGEKKGDAAAQSGSVKPIPDPAPNPLPPVVVDGKTPPKTDGDIMKAIQAAGTEGGRVLQAMQDPRTHTLMVSYSVLEGEDAHTLGAFVAQQSLTAIPDAPLVTIRGLKQGQAVYMADALRSLYEETLAPNWIAEHQSEPNAWIDHILTRTWPPVSATTPTPPVSGQTTSGVENHGAGPTDQTGTTTADAAASAGGSTTGKDDPSKPKDGGTPPADTAGAPKPNETGTTTGTSTESGAPPGEQTAAAGATTG
jgi:hypothetical protein